MHKIIGRLVGLAVSILVFGGVGIGVPRFGFLLPSAQAVSGTLNLQGSIASFSGQTTFGQNLPLRPAAGPLRLQYKSDLDTYSDGLILREGDGNVVVGSNVTPGDIAASKLSVMGTINGDKFQDAQNSAYFFDPAATGTSLTTAGNVGIGTTGPEGILELETSGGQTIMRIDNTAADGDSLINFRLPTVDEWSIGIDDGDGDKFKIADDSTLASARLTIDQSGNVGIGTTAPVGKLQVALGSNELAVLNDGSNASGIWGTNIGFLSASNEGRVTTAVGVPLVFLTGGTRNSMTAGTEYMRITTTGNVGIGTTAPGHALDVVGGITLLSDATANRKTFDLLQNGTVATIGTSYYGAGAYTPIYITPGGNQPLVLQSSGTGNVGIGTTGPTSLLDVKGTFNVTGQKLSSATGGTITTSGSYTIHTFTTSGTFTPNDTGNVEYLVVGGGGGGGGESPADGSGGGGGGGGGIVYVPSLSVTAGTGYTVTVGGGGNGGTTNGVQGSNGNSSSFAGVTTAGGGGGGGSAGSTPGPGDGGTGQATNGSGGGSAGYAAPTGGTGNGTGGNGGEGGVHGGGGGGGDTANGSNGTSANGGAGGDGTAYSISGSSVTYAGGGGGAAYTGSGGNGGAGGGGAGGGAGQAGVAGTANTGGGGGGASGNTAPGAVAGGQGGSGVVIIRYRTTPNSILVNSAGNVGFGTTGPESLVQISGGGLCVGSDTNCNTDNNTEGVVYSSSTAMTTYDLAENYPTKDTTLSPGEVVELDPANGVFVRRSSPDSPYTQKLLGIISTEPGALLGGFNGQQFKEEYQVAVALSGRVPVKIDPDSEPIEVGDFLTSSAKPGLAMKATRAGYTLGKTLESWKPRESDRIETFVQLAYYMGDIDPFGNLRTLEVETLKANTVKTKTLEVGGVNILDEINDIKRRLDAIEAR